MARARACRRKKLSDLKILETLIHSHFDLNQQVYSLVRVILAAEGVPPTGLINLLSITSGEVRAALKQKGELMDSGRGQDSNIKNLIRALGGLDDV